VGKWSAEFLKLLDHHDSNEIQQVLDWYAERAGEDYIPTAYSAKAFRQKFDALREAKARDARENESDLELLKTCPNYPELHGAALNLIETRIRPLGWPSGCGAQLEEVVTISLARARVLFDKMVRHISPYDDAKDADKPGTVRIVEEFLADYNDEESFIKFWFSGVPARIRKWKNFNGDIRIFTFSEDHDEFTRRGYAIAERFCGSGELWHFTMKKLNQTK
jgi:hypothetical protein